MLKKTLLATATIALAASGIAATPAAAQRYDSRYEQNYRGDRADAYDQAYRDGYNQDQPRRGYRDDRRGYDDRRYQRDDRRYVYRDNGCRKGDTGTIIGAIAGGLLGNSVAGRGDRTLGTVLGAGGGALAGRAIERSGNCYRR